MNVTDVVEGERCEFHRSRDSGVGRARSGRARPPLVDPCRAVSQPDDHRDGQHILNVAIPSLIRDLNATNSQVQWIIDSYTIVFAGLLLTTGSLSDRFGRKGALQAGIVLFMMGSVSSALASSAPKGSCSLRVIAFSGSRAGRTKP